MGVFFGTCLMGVHYAAIGVTLNIRNNIRAQTYLAEANYNIMRYKLMAAAKKPSILMGLNSTDNPSPTWNQIMTSNFEGIQDAEVIDPIQSWRDRVVSK